MNSGISLLAKTAFFNQVTITSSLRSHTSTDGTFYYISVTQIVKDDSCQQLYKVVKVTAKILSVRFPARCKMMS